MWCLVVSCVARSAFAFYQANLVVNQQATRSAMYPSKSRATCY